MPYPQDERQPGAGATELDEAAFRINDTPAAPAGGADCTDTATVGPTTGTATEQPRCRGHGAEGGGARGEPAGEIYGGAADTPPVCAPVGFEGQQQQLQLQPAQHQLLQLEPLQLEDLDGFLRTPSSDALLLPSPAAFINAYASEGGAVSESVPVERGSRRLETAAGYVKDDPAPPEISAPTNPIIPPFLSSSCASPTKMDGSNHASTQFEQQQACNTTSVVGYASIANDANKYINEGNHYSGGGGLMSPHLVGYGGYRQQQQQQHALFCSRGDDSRVLENHHQQQQQPPFRLTTELPPSSETDGMIAGRAAATASSSLPVPPAATTSDTTTAGAATHFDSQSGAASGLNALQEFNVVRHSSSDGGGSSISMRKPPLVEETAMMNPTTHRWPDLPPATTACAYDAPSFTSYHNELIKHPRLLLATSLSSAQHHQQDSSKSGGQRSNVFVPHHPGNSSDDAGMPGDKRQLCRRDDDSVATMVYARDMMPTTTAQCPPPPRSSSAGSFMLFSGGGYYRSDGAGRHDSPLIQRANPVDVQQHSPNHQRQMPDAHLLSQISLSMRSTPVIGMDSFELNNSLSGSITIPGLQPASRSQQGYYSPSGTATPTCQNNAIPTEHQIRNRDGHDSRMPPPITAAEQYQHTSSSAMAGSSNTLLLSGSSPPLRTHHEEVDKNYGTSTAQEAPSGSPAGSRSVRMIPKRRRTPKKLFAAAEQTDSLPEKCQIPSCGKDIDPKQKYNTRYRLCEVCIKSDSLDVGDAENVRFCQQCSCLHRLSEFDENRRSCREQLNRHKARRRSKEGAQQQS